MQEGKQEKSQSTADETERLLEELPCSSARAVDEVGSWKESFQLVVSSANWGAWVLQDCLSWCNLPEVRMDAWLATGKMYLWKPVQRGTCIHMFTWRVQVFETQWDKRPDCKALHGSVPQCEDWTRATATNRRVSVIHLYHQTGLCKIGYPCARFFGRAAARLILWRKGV